MPKSRSMKKLIKDGMGDLGPARGRSVEQQSGPGHYPDTPAYTNRAQDPSRPTGGLEQRQRRNIRPSLKFNEGDVGSEGATAREQAARRRRRLAGRK